MHAPPGRDHIVVPRVRDVVARSLFLTPRAAIGYSRIACAGALSCSPGDLPGFGVHLDLLTFLDEQGNADLQAGLERGQLRHATARGVSADAWFCRGDRQLHVGWKLDANGAA